MHSLTTYATKSIAALAGLYGPAAVFAHEGHGLAGGHWHATDALGYVAVAAVAAAIFWKSRK